MWRRVNIDPDLSMTRRRHAYHHGDLRRALIAATLECVVETGSTFAVTLREAARRVGVSHNAPYRHFEDKEALLTTIAEEGFVALRQTLESAREGVASPEQRFLATGHAYLRFAIDRPGYLIVMHSPELEKSRTAALQRAANDAFQFLKAQASDTGIEDPAEARRVGTVIWSFLYGLATLTTRNQVASSVAATPQALATLGLQHLFRSLSDGPGRVCRPS